MRPDGERRVPARRAILAWTTLCAAFAACATAAAFAFASAPWRPLEAVEGELLFEASRIRSGLALYVDPVAGAFDYGPVPSRYYALYTPLWPFLLSLFPAAAAPVCGRLIESVVWFSTLAGIVLAGSRGQRLRAAPFALAAGGLFLLTRAAISATGDALAVALVALGVLRATRRNAVSPSDATLFVVAALVKPNICMAGCGALLCDVWLRKRRAAAPLLTAAFIALTGVALLEVSSHGAWYNNLLRSTRQELSLTRWLEQVFSRFVFLGLPHMLITAAAIRWVRVDRRGAYPLASLVASLAWTLFTMAKSGSATNYWLEPTAMALVTLTLLPEQPLGPALLPAIKCVGAGIAIAVALTSIPRYRAAWRNGQETIAAIAKIRNVCPMRRGEAILASDPGLEMMLNGRVIATPFQTTFLARHGLFPFDVWANDIARPQIVCFACWGDLVDRPAPRTHEEYVETTAYRLELRDQILETFAPAAVFSGIHVYRRRPP